VCVCAQSKSFQLALREASREKLRLEREGEHFGYRIIPDDDLSDTSSSSSSSSSSSLPDPPVAAVAAAVPGKRRRANTVSRGRRKKQTSVRAARQPRTAAADGKQAQSSSSSSSSDDESSSSSSSVPYTTLPDETDLSVLLPGKQSTLETAAARWAATRLQMASDANEWAVVLVLLARLSAMSATLDALRLSGVGKQVKRASKAPHAATASMATQLMGRWAALVRDTLKQSTDVISHTGTLKESSADAVVKDETAAELAPPPRTQEAQQEQGDEREHQQEQQSEKQ
jgi:hypothetical protein